MYVPGFTNSLRAPLNQGGPEIMQMPVGSVPVAAAAPSISPPQMSVTRADMLRGLDAPMSASRTDMVPGLNAPQSDPWANFTTAPNYNPRVEGINMSELGLDDGPVAPGVMASPEDLLGRSPQTQADIDRAFAQFQQTGFLPMAGMNRNGVAGAYFRDNRGRAASLKGDKTSGFVSFDPNGQYRLVDRATGQVLASGTGADGMRAVHLASQQLSQDRKGRADWAVEELLPGSQDWRRTAEDRPDKSTIGKIGDIALPMIGAALAPLTGGASAALMAGLGAAGGSALSSTLQGRSLQDTLLRAGITGVTAGGLSAGSSALASGAGGALPGAALGAGTMAQAGLNLVNPGILVSGALGGAGAAAAGAAAGSALGGAASGALGSGGQASGGGHQIVVTGQPSPQVPGIPVPPIPVPSNPAGGPSSPVDGGHQIEVTAPRPTDPDLGLPAVLPPFSSVPTNTGGTSQGMQPPAEESDGRISLDDIIRYLRAGSLGIGVLGSLFGGGGRQHNVGFIPPGFGGGLNPVFGGNLPAPTMPGASDNFAQRPANYDWYRYGYGPGQSFFNYVPQAQPNNSQAYTGYAEGGVAGAGTGRSDEIPALLSDGEYIIDAETVALLGDGSTKAGADRLDDFRVNIRKHKGAQLAKGDFSPDARDPMHYLKGGRT